MSAGERFGPLSGPFSNISQACFGSLDVMARRFEPVALGAARCNLELFGLMTRRARAWLEIPTRLGQCRTPQDLAGEQLRFWRTAVEDYTDVSRRLTVALFAPSGFDAGRKAAGRDYLAFPDAKRAGDETAKRDRRAA
jgi:hypothetical protein